MNDVSDYGGNDGGRREQNTKHSQPFVVRVVGVVDALLESVYAGT